MHGSQPIFVWRLGKNSIFNIFSILNTQLLIEAKSHSILIYKLIS